MIGARITDYPFDERTHVVAVEGRLDIHTEPRLNERVLDVMDQGKRRIVLDLSKVEFADSAAVTDLVDILRSLHPAQGSMALVTRDRGVERLFRVTGLHNTFLIQHNVEFAVAALEGTLEFGQRERGPSA